MRQNQKGVSGSGFIGRAGLVLAATVWLLPASADAADAVTATTTGPPALRAPDPGTSCGPMVSDPGPFCLDMGRQFRATNADIRFPNYQEVADQIARSPDAAKRAKATEYLNQAREAWTSGFHETALDLLRTAQVALY